MSSAYSIIHNYEQPKDSPDFALINQALAYKQESFDAHKAKLQSMADQIAVLKVARDVDQNYIDDRLNTVLKTTNSAMRGMDLSDENFYQSLAANVNQVLDGNIKSAVLSTQQIKGEEVAMAQLRKNDKDGKYSQLNHQYAIEKSDRRRYLTSTTLGDEYKGGFNYTEYRDVSKKLLEVIPKLDPILKEKFVEYISEGSFRNIATYEKVDQEKIQQAMAMALDPTDMAQLNINSWASYSKISDEDLKQEFENYIQPKIDFVDERIRANENALATDDTLTADEKETLRNQIADQKLSLTAMKENNNFEGLMQGSGREFVEQSLYKAKYFDNVTGLFSYDRKLVDIKLDDAHARGVELAEKQRQFDLDFEFKAKQFEENKRQFNIKNPNGQLVDPATGKAVGTTDGSFIASWQEISTDLGFLGNIVTSATGDEVNILENFEATSNAAYQTMRKVIRERIGTNLSNASFQEFAEKIKLHEIPASGEYIIKLNNGIQVKLDAKKDYNVLSSFSKNFVEKSPARTAYYDHAKTVISSVQRDLTALVKGKNTELSTHVPEFGFQVVGDDKSGFKVVRTANKNNYITLLKKVADKKQLSAAEQKTLESYHALTLASGDESAGDKADFNRKNLYAYMRDVALKGVKGQELIPSYSQVTKGSSTSKVTTWYQKSNKTLYFLNALKKEGYKSVPESNSTTGNTSYMISPSTSKADYLITKLDELYAKQDLRALTPQENALKEKYKKEIKDNLNPAFKASEDDLGDLGYRDSRFFTNKGKQVSLGDMESRLDDLYTRANKELESVVKTSNPLKKVGVVGYNVGSQQHAVALKYLGTATGIKPDFEGPILAMVSQTDPTKISLGYRDTKGVLQERTFERNLLEEQGLKIDSGRVPDYDASQGQYARKLNLGSNALTNTQKQVALAQGILPFATYSPDILVKSIAPQFNMKGNEPIFENVKSLITAYQKGDLSFQIEAIDGTYYETIRSKTSLDPEENLIGIGDMIGKEIFVESEKKLTQNARDINEKILNNVIEKNLAQ